MDLVWTAFIPPPSPISTVLNNRSFGFLGTMIGPTAGAAMDRAPVRRRRQIPSSASILERRLFASTSQSLGQRLSPYPAVHRLSGKRAMEIRASCLPWPQRAGIERQLSILWGGWRNSSSAEIDRQRAEETARKAADIEWLREGFQYAASVGAKGVMIIWQADLNFNNEQHLPDTRSWDAFPGYVDALRTLTLGFPGQVVLVHGDSHYFKMDKPINGPSDGVLANFTRIETFGARNTHWVSARIDPTDPNLFAFEPRIVPRTSSNLIGTQGRTISSLCSAPLRESANFS